MDAFTRFKLNASKRLEERAEVLRRHHKRHEAEVLERRARRVLEMRAPEPNETVRIELEP